MNQFQRLYNSKSILTFIIKYNFVNHVLFYFEIEMEIDMEVGVSIKSYFDFAKKKRKEKQKHCAFLLCKLHHVTY